MFLGEYQHALDIKGRLTVPSRLREGLGDSFVVTKGLENCLFLYPLQEWKIIEEKLKSLPLTRADARAFVRFFFSGACECEVDKQGRILLPQNLREYALIERDVVIIGAGTRAEVWSRAKWEEYSRTAENSYELLAENLVDLGI